MDKISIETKKQAAMTIVFFMAALATHQKLSAVKKRKNKNRIY
jgi:hypothetical protein